MRRRTMLGAAGLVATVPGVVATAGQAAAAERGDRRGRRAIDAAVIAEVAPEGYQVTGLAIEYDGIVHPGRDELDPDAFEVTATLSRPGAEPRTGPRTVVAAYPNDAAEFTDRPRPGRWVVLELDAADALAASAYNDGFTRYYDLSGAYRVRQGGGTPLTNSGVRNRLVDDYAAATFEATSGATVPYRFFTPTPTPATRPGRRYPLVVSLHGHGESGNDNFSQLAGNQISVAFADPARQRRHPAFVLSPQAPQGAPGTGGWWRSDVRAGVLELVRTTLAGNRAIDPRRVYLTGLSMGSYGSWALLPEHHDLFAAAVLVCGAGDEAAAVGSLGEFPIWALHSEDDAVVPYDVPGSDYRIFRALEAAGRPTTWSEWAGNAPAREQKAYADDARRRAAATGSRHVFTTFPPGTTPLFSHASWIPTYTNDAVIDWLLNQ
ncbi:PHB depolymerase family esterase [Streptomyces hainanensis]|uniref:Phospholipase n=1 Tax=Streptomyces hainanensis TaxID=402648 RepID=A0A4R4TE23_9ACTN|nr:PHB depolymerase family esterase [Streptomyces hainanensis]TDC75761.1 phospholipase [Streptomyces hainanensis]